MDFIFMLTDADRTVPECLEVVDEIASLGIGHIGFKDVGSAPGISAELNRRIKQGGATSYLEVVSTDPAEVVRAAELAIEIGVDCLLGGVAAETVAARVAGTGIRYYPFAGRAVGHPSNLHGSAEEIAADCRRLEAAGCAGVDLLAYRAVDADPLDLIRQARANLAGRLIVAGSIVTADQIRLLEAAGVDAFTIGSAIFRRQFAEHGTLIGQLQAVLAATAACAETP
jgi:hypothetical protein